MKLLAEISDKSLGLSEQDTLLGSNYSLRKSGRVILLSDQGEMATQFLETHQYHKLPGGGVDRGETIEEAAKREILEEVGCACELISEVGMTIEYRNEYNLIHLSYCFVGKQTGPLETPRLEQKEIEDGHTTLWLAPAEALKRMKADQPQKYSARFIRQREVRFLEAYLEGLL